MNVGTSIVVSTISGLCNTIHETCTCGITLQVHVKPQFEEAQ